MSVSGKPRRTLWLTSLAVGVLVVLVGAFGLYLHSRARLPLDKVEIAEQVVAGLNTNDPAQVPLPGIGLSNGLARREPGLSESLPGQGCRYELQSVEYRGKHSVGDMDLTHQIGLGLMHVCKQATGADQRMTRNLTVVLRIDMGAWLPDEVFPDIQASQDE